MDLEPLGEGEAGHTPQGPGGRPGLTLELGRVATTWAAGQAAERSQWVLKLWKATEEKRAALVALKQSEETLHQVWPPWLGPLIGVPSAALLQEETPGSPVNGAVKSSAGAAASWHGRGLRPTSWLEGQRGPASHLRSPSLGRKPATRGYRAGAPAGKALGRGRPRDQQETEQHGPVREEQPQVRAPWLLKINKQEQPRPMSYTGPTGLERPQVEGPCRPESVKQEEPGA